MPSGAPENRLINETSLYLLQHAHNPVDWYPWGEEAFRRARELDRPLLVSIGYAACHWCHVMERESFENPAIADLMNRDFVCVKVDREERTDLDRIYMTAVQLMTGEGGWPLTVFLTPDGKPFYGGTYFPPEDRFGRPGFPRILQAVAEAWQQHRDVAEHQGAELVRQIRAASEEGAAPAPITGDTLDAAADVLWRSHDQRRGGFGGAPKFPHPMALDFLLRHAARTGAERSRETALFTLERMAEGGIHDQLAGGFHRYSTDEYWLAPHFEKMLYDNAMLASTYLHAFRLCGTAVFRRVVERTLDFIQRELTAPGGGFWSALDADTEGEEGRHYVWTVDEVEEVLGKEDAALFCRFYDVTPRGNWGKVAILNVSCSAERFAEAVRMKPDALRVRLDGMRARMLARRRMRVMPACDDQVQVAWNGLALSAFAEAGAVLGRDDYLQTARNNAAFVLEELRHPASAGWSEAGGPLRLMHSAREIPVESPMDVTMRDTALRVGSTPGFLDDHTCYAAGLLTLYEATGRAEYYRAAVSLAETAIADFRGPDGLLCDTSGDAADAIVRPRELADSATPSGSSMAAEVLLRLWYLSGEDRWLAPATNALARMSRSMAACPLAFGWWLCVADRLVGAARQVVIAGDREDERTAALLHVARAGWRPNDAVVPSVPGETGGAPVTTGRGTVDGAPGAYVCENGTCSLPITEPAQLVDMQGA